MSSAENSPQTVTVRLPAEERAALEALAEQAGLTRSAVVRAGVRAVVADPTLLLGSAVADGASASSSARRTKRRRK